MISRRSSRRVASKTRAPPEPVFDVDGEPRRGKRRVPDVFHVHPQEGGDVEALLRPRAQAGARRFRAPPVEDVAVLLAPRRVVDLGHQRFEALAVRSEAVVEAHRVEAVPEGAQVGEQPDGAVRPPAGLRRDQVADRGVEGRVRVAEMVAAVQPGEVRAAGRPQPAALEHRVQFAEVQVHEEQRVLERVGMRLEAPVPDPPRVERARPGAAGHAATPSRRATASALTTPSSWKPWPQ